MKKTLNFLTWMLVMALAVSFSSCKDDDEETSTNILVGTWVSTETDSTTGDVYTETWIFNNDETGTYRETETGVGTNYNSTETFTYIYDSTTGLLLIFYDSDNGNRYYSYYVTVSGTRLLLYRDSSYSTWIGSYTKS